MLASDVHNPEFSGATNPDDALFVEFYWHEPLDTWHLATTGQKRYFDKQPFVLIQRSGDQTTVIRTPIREEHKRRFPRQWMHFQMKEGLVDTKNLPGTPLESWDEIKDKADYLLDLKSKRFFTVESIAMASDAQVQGIGMGGLGLREKAKQFLKAQLGAEVKNELAKKDSEIAELRQMVETLASEVRAKKGPGRPRNEDKEAA